MPAESSFFRQRGGQHLCVRPFLCCSGHIANACAFAAGRAYSRAAFTLFFAQEPSDPIPFRTSSGLCGDLARIDTAAPAQCAVFRLADAVGAPHP